LELNQLGIYNIKVSKDKLEALVNVDSQGRYFVFNIKDVYEYIKK